MRFTRGMTYIEDRGCGNIEPDEDYNVPRMTMLDFSADPTGPDRETAEYQGEHVFSSTNYCYVTLFSSTNYYR